MSEQVRVCTRSLAAQRCPGMRQHRPSSQRQSRGAPAAPASGRAGLCQRPRSRCPFPCPLRTSPPLPGAAGPAGCRGTAAKPQPRRTEPRGSRARPPPEGSARAAGRGRQGSPETAGARTCSARHRRQAASEPRGPPVPSGRGRTRASHAGRSLRSRQGPSVNSEIKRVPISRSRAVPVTSRQQRPGHPLARLWALGVVKTRPRLGQPGRSQQQPAFTSWESSGRDRWNAS